MTAVASKSAVAEIVMALNKLTDEQLITLAGFVRGIEMCNELDSKNNPS